MKGKARLGTKLARKVKKQHEEMMRMTCSQMSKISHFKFRKNNYYKNQRVINSNQSINNNKLNYNHSSKQIIIWWTSSSNWLTNLFISTPRHRSRTARRSTQPSIRPSRNPLLQAARGNPYSSKDWFQVGREAIMLRNACWRMQVVLTSIGGVRNKQAWLMVFTLTRCWLPLTTQVYQLQCPTPPIVAVI